VLAPEAADEAAIVVGDGDDLIAVRPHDDRILPVGASLSAPLPELEQAFVFVVAHEGLPALAHDLPVIRLLDDDPAAGFRVLVALAAQVLNIAEADHGCRPCSRLRRLSGGAPTRLSRRGLDTLEDLCGRLPRNRLIAAGDLRLPYDGLIATGGAPAGPARAAGLPAAVARRRADCDRGALAGPARAAGLPAAVAPHDGLIADRGGTSLALARAAGLPACGCPTTG